MHGRLFEPAGIRAYPTRAAWDAAATEILATMLDRWALTAGGAFTGGYAGTVLAVTRADGSPAVLKIGFPHAEGRPEAVALEAYPRGTAPLVLRQDPWTWSMLLERIDPGTPLAEAGLDPDDALLAGAGLLARLGRADPVDGIPELRTVVAGYSAAALARWAVHREHFDALGATDLVSSALDDLVELAADDVPVAMLHGDFNPGNILCSAAGVIAIDPKPVIGDPAFDLWPLVSQLGAPFARSDPPTVLARQLELAAGVAGVDAQRAARWAVARAALTVGWYLDENNIDLAARSVRELVAWSRVRSQHLASTAP